jgi:hypothetical protein
MNTERMANTSMPYMPEPTPPGVISPNWMLAMVTSPPSGVKLSWEALTAPVLVDVVASANAAL